MPGTSHRSRREGNERWVQVRIAPNGAAGRMHPRIAAHSVAVKWQAVNLLLSILTVTSLERASQNLPIPELGNSFGEGIGTFEF